MCHLGSSRARGARLCWQPGEERCALRLGSGARPVAQGAVLLRSVQRSSLPNLTVPWALSTCYPSLLLSPQTKQLQIPCQALISPQLLGEGSTQMHDSESPRKQPFEEPAQCKCPASSPSPAPFQLGSPPATSLQVTSTCPLPADAGFLNPQNYVKGAMPA